MRERYFIVGCLIGVLIATLLYAPLSGSEKLYSLQYGEAGTGEYDPWLDINDDGKINVEDSIAIWQAYGTTGDPTKPVTINHKVQLYNFSKVIAPRGTVSFNISVAGFKQATIIIMANKSSPFYLEARTGFSLGKCYTFSSWFAATSSEQYPKLPIPPWVEPQIWLDPTHIRIDDPKLGYKFNVTVRVSEGYWHPLNVSAWQVCLEYDGYILEVTRILEPIWDPEYIFYNKTTLFLSNFGHRTGGNQVLAGALLYPTNQTPSRGNGKLCIIEFSIKNMPKLGEQSILLNINNNYTYLVDPYVQEIEVRKYNAMIEWKFDGTIRTIEIIGPILIIECYNPNDDQYIEVILEIYLTT